MIRHGNSVSNEAMIKLIEKHGDQLNVGHFCDKFYRKDMIDCSLTELGIQECLKAGQHALKIPFEEVWISPLRRTLETAFHIFKNHPNFGSIKFKVEPLLREKIRVPPDMPSRHLVAEGFQELFNGNLDLSLMKGFDFEKVWYFDSLD